MNIETRLIYKATWHFHKTTGIEYDEVLGIAGVSYSIALRDFDPEKGSFSTLFWRCMRNAIVDFQRKMEMETDTFDFDFDETRVPPNTKNPEKAVIFKDLIEKMEKRASDICKLVLSNAEIAELADKPKLARGKIKQKLRDQNWKWRDIWEGFDEIKNSLKM